MRCPIAAGREVARVQRIRNQLECNRRFGSAGVWSQASCRRILDPELAQIRPNAVDRTFVQLAPFAVPASYTENLMEEEPLFNTSTGNDASRKPFCYG